MAKCDTCFLKGACQYESFFRDFEKEKTTRKEVQPIGKLEEYHGSIAYEKVEQLETVIFWVHVECSKRLPVAPMGALYTRD